MIRVLLEVFCRGFIFRFCSGKRRYNIKLWKTFTDCFNCLPVAAIVDEKIFCCHGGRLALNNLEACLHEIGQTKTGVWCLSRPLSRSSIHGADPQGNAAHRCAWPGFVVWPAVGWPRQGCAGLGWKRPWRFLHIRGWCGGQIFAQTRHGPYMQGAPGRHQERPHAHTRRMRDRHVLTLSFLSWGGRRWLRVFRQEAACHSVLSSELLRWVWQCWCHDERGWDTHVLLPGMYHCTNELIISRFRILITLCLDFIPIIVKFKSWKI